MFVSKRYCESEGPDTMPPTDDVPWLLGRRDISLATLSHIKLISDTISVTCCHCSGILPLGPNTVYTKYENNKQMIGTGHLWSLSLEEDN